MDVKGPLVIVACLGTACAGSPTEPAAPRRSAQSSPRAPAAPEPKGVSFTLPSDRGESVTLPLPDGQPAVLEFWAPSCEPCADSLAAIEARRAEITNAGARLILVGVLPREMSPELARQRLADWGVSTEFLIDRESVSREALGVRALPATIVLDGAGKVRFTAVRPRELEGIVAAAEAARSLD